MRKWEKQIVRFILWNIKYGWEIGSSDSVERPLICCFGNGNKLIGFIKSKLLGLNMELGLI